jgi:hypothetical protein
MKSAVFHPFAEQELVDAAVVDNNISIKNGENPWQKIISTLATLVNS